MVGCIRIDVQHKEVLETPLELRLASCAGTTWPNCLSGTKSGCTCGCDTPVNCLSSFCNRFGFYLVPA